MTWSHLATTPSEGGALARLAPARDSRGGRRSPNGTILFSPFATGPLPVISDREGPSRAVTGSAEEIGTGTHRFPQFLADGEHFVYLDRSGRVGSAEGGLMVGTLGETAPAKRLPEGATNVVSAGGHLLFSRDGRRAAVGRVDEEQSDADTWLYDVVRGTETRLARQGTDESDPLFSRDGGALYVAPFSAGGSKVRVSLEGGIQPRWNPGGGELFFKTPDDVLTAVPIETGTGTVSVGTPVPLFPIVEFTGSTYDATADGTRFLVREPLAGGDASPNTLLTDRASLAGSR